MPRETGLVLGERTEWPHLDSIRQKLHCETCGVRARLTGRPGAVDRVAEELIDTHAASCEGPHHA